MLPLYVATYLPGATRDIGNLSPVLLRRPRLLLALVVRLHALLIRSISGAVVYSLHVGVIVRVAVGRRQARYVAG